jgi:hypothetical protein
VENYVKRECGCPDGNYLVNSALCNKCNETCELCMGTSTFCQKCTIGNYLNVTTCGPICPVGKYASLLDEEAMCHNCTQITPYYCS